MSASSTMQSEEGSVLKEQHHLDGWTVIDNFTITLNGTGNARWFYHFVCPFYVVSMPRDKSYVATLTFSFVFDGVLFLRIAVPEDYDSLGWQDLTCLCPVSAVPEDHCGLGWQDVTCLCSVSAVP